MAASLHYQAMMLLRAQLSSLLLVRERPRQAPSRGKAVAASWSSFLNFWAGMQQTHVVCRSQR
jgi:hypothetical protein